MWILNLEPKSNIQKALIFQGILTFYTLKGRFKMQYTIKQNSSKSYDVNSDEELYFNTLYSKLTDFENKQIHLHRLSNGSLETYFGTYPLGKVKLQGRKHYMQILKSLYKWESIEGTIQDFLPRIDDVIKYLRKYCK